MTHGSSMKLSIRKRPPHLGQVKGSTRYTLRMRRAQARLRNRRKSSSWTASGQVAAAGIAAAAL